MALGITTRTLVHSFAATFGLSAILMQAAVAFYVFFINYYVNG